ncbi:hypothetical protein [Micromonospora arborensis]|uniref:hypothetical protein n=1 Tax=Micromonospora arborensis TaxID=2116518 RepID=UPI00370FE13C
MAFRTWGRLLLTALGVSVLAGAGQLGVAYGFGIVRLTGAYTGTTVNQWPAQLVWVGWFAANAAVAGAVLTGRLARRDAPAASIGRQLAIGGAAALGATVIAPLCMQPARAAELISVDPVWAVGICAVLGAVIGAGAAIAVLLRPELGWNMAAVAGAVWLLALISVLPSLGTTGALPTVRLGVLEPSWLNDAAAQQLALLLLPTVALLAGAATAGLARWRGQAPLVSGATGVAGPVLVAFAYLTAGPGDAVDRYQVSPYYAALIAILAGALGAAAAALLRWPTSARTADSQAIEPSDILRPLPSSPALPGTEPPVGQPAGAELTGTEPPGGQPAGAELTGTERAGTAPGPRAVGGSDGVRTVPAHWDWPATTASGQHGPTPAAPSTPAAWRTDPTTDFSTEALTTRRSSRDAVTSPADTAPPADSAPPATDVSSSTEATPTSTTAGRAGAAAPAGGPADEPTGSATTVTGDRPATTSKAATSKAIPSKAIPSTEPTSAAPTSATPTSATPASAGAPSFATTNPATSSADTTNPATSSADTTNTDTTSTGAADAGTADAPLTLKPRRTRKPKASPDVTTSPTSDDTPSPDSDTTAETTTAETTTGRTRKVTRPGKSADRTAPGEATGTPARSAENQDSGSGLPIEAIPAAGSAASTAAAAPATATGSTGAPATATGSTGAPATPTAAKPRAGGSPRTPAEAATGPAGSPAEPASGPAATSADETDSARPATEVGSTAGLFGITAGSDPDTDRWTPTAPAWPVASAWTVPPQGADPAPSETAAGSAEPTEPTPRPRHRAPLPDLSRASTWDAFNTTRRAGPSQSPSPSPSPSQSQSQSQSPSPSPSDARSTSTDSTAASEPAAPATPTSTTASPVVPGQAVPAEPVAPERQSSPTAAPAVPGQAGAPSAAADPTTTDDAPTAPVVAEQQSRRGRLGGLFRRKGSRTEEESQEPSDETEPLPTQDEEFVDWVAGLSKPVSDNEPEQESGRRSLRSTGRHYRD